MRKNIYILFVFLLLIGCKENESTLHTGEDISLESPQKDIFIDFEDVTVTQYVFEWNRNLEKGGNLIFSTTEDFSKSVQIDAGYSNSIILSVEDLEKLLSQLDITPGIETMLYWRVQENITGKISDVYTFSVKLKEVAEAPNLISPAPSSSLFLLEELPDTKVSFEWSVDGQPEGASYELCLSVDPQMQNNLVKFGSVTSDRILVVTHEQLQGMLDELPIRRYVENDIYWNILVNGTEFISSSPSVIKLTEMMRFVDRRGEEENIYRVTRINYSDGTSQVWLADNLRSYKYPDGSNIDKTMYKEYSSSLGSEKCEAYGICYHNDIRNNIAPTGWRLPSVSDFEKLFEEAGKSEGGYNVLKDSVFYEAVKDAPHLDEWGLNLCASGRWNSGKDEIDNYDTKYCYLLVKDAEEEGVLTKCMLHDGGPTLWWSGVKGAPARFIFNE